MRTNVAVLISLLTLSQFSSSLPAQCCYIPPPPAPDMRNPGFYWTSPSGVTFGPNYCVTPPFPPFQGMILGPPKAPPPQAAAPGAPVMYGAMGGSLGFPSHLYARSPRDYFMIDFEPASNPYNYGASSPLYGAGMAAPR